MILFLITTVLLYSVECQVKPSPIASRYNCFGNFTYFSRGFIENYCSPAHPNSNSEDPGCFCPKNMAITPDNTCVNIRDCPRTTNKPPTTKTPIKPICTISNEIEDRCGDVCEHTCQNKDENFYCGRKCGAIQCVCNYDKGFVRDDYGQCVLREQCDSSPGPIPVCPQKNEIFDQCGNNCERTCETAYLRNLCIKKCGDPSCSCDFDHGFVRNKKGICIPIEYCS
uniref:TIL domain-containing protein n=1 Tax=Rhabditophanes sp. KR3021 TaxID=114890 RepID=A0AC35TMV2_9BILA